MISISVFSSKDQSVLPQQWMPLFALMSPSTSFKIEMVSSLDIET